MTARDKGENPPRVIVAAFLLGLFLAGFIVLAVLANRDANRQSENGRPDRRQRNLSLDWSTRLLLGAPAG